MFVNYIVWFKSGLYCDRIGYVVKLLKYLEFNAEIKGFSLWLPVMAMAFWSYFIENHG